MALLLTQLPSGGSGAPRQAAAHSVPPAPVASRTPKRKRTPAVAGASSSGATSTGSAAASDTSTAAAPPSAPAASSTAPASAPAAPGSGDPVALMAQGHQQMLAGSYPAAITTLQRAVASASPGSVTYAYALFDLGRSLLLSGNAPAAVSILEQRLKIPNQIPVVQALLNQARSAAGQAPAGQSQASNGAGHAPGHGNGNGNGGT